MCFTCNGCRLFNARNFGFWTFNHFGEDTKSIAFLNFGIEHMPIFVLKIIYSLIIFLSNPINLFPVYSIIYEFKFIKTATKRLRAPLQKREDVDCNGDKISSLEKIKKVSKKQVKPTSMEDILIEENLRKNNAKIKKRNKLKIYFFRLVIRVCVMLVSFLIAVVSPNFVKFISFIGSFVFSILGFVFPVSGEAKFRCFFTFSTSKRKRLFRGGGSL